MKLVFATRNPGKLAELRALAAALPLEVLSLDDAGVHDEVIEDGRSFEANARKKAEAARDASHLAALADDSGLEVAALDGAPGVDSAYWAGLPSGSRGADEANNRRLVRELASVPPPRAARYRCVLALAAPGEPTIIEEGAVAGEIVLEPRGTGGFGYDPYFLVPTLGRTMAELSPAEKNTLSHRGLAMRRMLPHLPRVAPAISPLK